MDSFVQLYIGFPVAEPVSMARKFFDSAEITKTTATKIVLKDDAGGKMVFYGDYTVNGETTGTMTGFKYKDDGVKLMEGSGYEVDAADLLDALDESPKKVDAAVGEIETVFDLLFPDGILIKGSDQGDYLIGIDRDDATVKGKDGDDVIAGGEGNQILKGNKGNDLIAGGGEKDKLFGGKGDDAFSFAFGSLIKEASDPPVAPKSRISPARTIRSSCRSRSWTLAS